MSLWKSIRMKNLEWAKDNLTPAIWEKTIKRYCPRTDGWDWKAGRGHRPRSVDAGHRGRRRWSALPVLGLWDRGRYSWLRPRPLEDRLDPTVYMFKASWGASRRRQQNLLFVKTSSSDQVLGACTAAVLATLGEVSTERIGVSRPALRGRSVWRLCY